MSAPTKAESEAAHGAYIAGKGSFDEADYATAISYFRDAYRRDCTKHELLTIIARAFEAKGDRAEAVNALETYLKRVPGDPNAEQIQRRINNLRAQIAAQSPAPKPSVSPPPPPPVAEPKKSPTPSLSGANARALPTEPVAPRPPALAPWIIVGVGAAVAIGGGVVFGVGAAKVADADSRCPSRVNCLMADTETGNSGRTLRVVGGVTFGVGLAAAAGGLIWHLTERGTKSESQLGLLPAVGLGYAGLSFHRAF